MGKTRFVNLALAVVGIGCVAVSFAVYWYRLESDGLITGKQDFFFTKVKSTTGTGSFQVTSEDEYGGAQENIKRIFNTCLSFLTIGGAVLLGFIALTALSAFFFRKSSLLKLLCVIASIAATVLLSISFFTFLGITDAFEEDGWSCLSFGETQCDKFIGTDDDYKWGPGPGWWILIGAILMSALASIGALKSFRD